MHRRGTPSTFVISQTPFYSDGEVDWDGFRSHLGRLKEAGIGVYVGGGGSGEGHTLLPHEIETLLAIAAEELVGSVPARAMGVEPRTARQMIEFAKQVETSGLEAMQVYSLDMGHTGMPRAEELEAYFRDVLDNIDLPSVISTHFSVGYMVPVELLCKLCDEYDSIIGINCSIREDMIYLVRLLDELPSRVQVHVGGPLHTLSALAMGATGFLSSEGNLAPKLAKSLIDKYAAGDYPGAEEAYAKIMLLFSLGMRGMSGGKALARSLGLPGGFPRRPRLDLSTPESLERARRYIAAIDVPELDTFLNG